MGSKVHKQKYGEEVLTPKRHWKDMEFDTSNNMPQTYSTSWRAKNPTVDKVKFRDIQLRNRFDFANEAPKRFKNFAWLKKNRRKDWFGVSGKDFIRNEHDFK